MATPSFVSSLKPRSDLHLIRKFWHVAMGLVMTFCYWKWMTREQGCFVLFLSLLFFLGMEIVRLKFQKLNALVLKVWGPLMRESERDSISGTPYYIASVLISIWVFPKPIAILSILVLAIGDPIASIFGILYGRYWVRFSNGKSLIGTFAGVVGGTAVSIFALKQPDLFPAYSLEKALIIASVGGVSGGGAELLPMQLDDNFIIPIVSGFFLWITFVLFHL